MGEVLDVRGEPVSLELDWPAGLGAGLFIGALSVDDAAGALLGRGPGATELAVFGARRALTHSPGAWRAEYLIRERRADGTFRAHHLAQHGRHVLFCAADDPCTSEAVDMLKKGDLPCARRRPRWKQSEASWPFTAGVPSLFLGQLYLPETPTTRERFSWDDSLYVFASRDGGALRLQIASQDMSAQTAEEHYRLEEMLVELDRGFGEPEVVRRLIEQGDRYFYEALFDHPRLDRDTLGLIAQHAKTKSVRERATRELRRRQSG